MKYAAVEGPSYAGKTTVLEGLARRGIEFVPEYDNFVDLNDPRAQRDFMYMANLLIDAERKRSQLVERTTADLVFSDRSVASMFTFYDAASKYGFGDKAEIERAREYVLTRVDKELTSGNIIPFNVAVVLRLNSRVDFEARVACRGVTPVSQLASYDVCQYISDRASHYCGKVVGSSSLAEIDVSGKNPQCVEEMLLGAVELLDPSPKLLRAA